MRRWKLKLIVGVILGLILSIFVFVPFNVEAYNNQGYQFIAYKRIITDGGGEETNQINIIADLSSEEVEFSNSIFTITTYLNKSWSASYGNEVDLDLMELNSYYLINRLLNYDEAAYFVTKLSDPFENLEAIFSFLGISYTEGYNQGYEEGYNKGFAIGPLGNTQNLINVLDLSDKISNGIEFDNLQNGKIKINGTATANISYYFNGIEFIEGHKYLLLGNFSQIISDPETISIRLYNQNPSVSYITTGDLLIQSFAKSISIRPYVVVIKGTTINNLTIFPQLYDLTAAGIEANTVEEALNKMKFKQGFDEGYDEGINIGYKNGVNQGTKDSFTLINFLGNIISVFFSAAFTFLSFEVFGIKLWEIFSIAAAAAVIIVVYRLIKGGGD